MIKALLKLFRASSLNVLCFLRRSALRRPLLHLFSRLHNSSYHWFSFFASGNGTHPKHAITNYHQFFLDHIQPSDRVIDLGCGQGELSFDLARRARSVTGVDQNADSIARAAKQYRHANLTFMVGDITALADNQRYDVAVLSNVLEHINHRLDLLRAIQTYADKILIRVPLITRDWITVYKQQLGFEYRLDHTHFIEYSTASFQTEMVAAGLAITNLHIAFGELFAVCESRPSGHALSYVKTNHDHRSPLVSTKQKSVGC